MIYAWKLEEKLLNQMLNIINYQVGECSSHYVEKVYLVTDFLN